MNKVVAQQQYSEALANLVLFGGCTLGLSLEEIKANVEVEFADSMAWANENDMCSDDVLEG